MRKNPRRNLLAGLTVAIVALPLALAFGVTSGMGAQAGLATAVVAGIVAALFGGSNLQVSGPTGAMTVVLVPVVHQYGASGALMVGAMAGLVLIAMAVARLGRYVRYLPVSVIEGFTAGIAVVISLQQVPAALGVTDASGDKVWQIAADAVSTYARAPDPRPLLIAVGVAALMLVGARWRPGVPFSLIGVALATIAARAFDLNLSQIGRLPAHLPAPSFEFVDPGAVGSLITAACAIAALAALESLMCATVADGMSVNEQHDPDRELFGQGLANVAVPLFGGVPATAAIARTAVNVRAGATSRLAAVSHSVVLLIVIFAAAPLVSDIPLAALAGVLFATCVRMVETGSILALLRSTRSGCVDRRPHLHRHSRGRPGHSGRRGGGSRRGAGSQNRRSKRPPRDRPARGREITRTKSTPSSASTSSPIASTARCSSRRPIDCCSSSLRSREVRVVILRMSRVTAVDATGARVLGDTITRLERRGIIVMLSGICPSPRRRPDLAQHRRHAASRRPDLRRHPDGDSPRQAVDRS